MSHLNKDDVLAKARQELCFGSAATVEEKKEKRSLFSVFTSKRFIPLAASVACVFTLFAGMIGLYNENYQTIYIDVNPSVALTLNRFDRVIEVKYLNDDAKNLLSKTDLVGSDVEDAVQTVISTCDKAGFVKDDSEIYLSATSKNEETSEELLNKLKGSAQTMKKHDFTPEADSEGESETYAVSTYNTKKEEKEKFDNSDISPAKDKIIREIADEDENYKPDELKGKSMYELSHIKKNLHKHDDDHDDDRDDDKVDDDRDDDRDEPNGNRPEKDEEPNKTDREEPKGEDDSKFESDREDGKDFDDRDEEDKEDKEDKEDEEGKEHGKDNGEADKEENRESNKKPSDKPHDDEDKDSDGDKNPSDKPENGEENESDNGKKPNKSPNGEKNEDFEGEDLEEDEEDEDDEDDDEKDGSEKPQSDKKPMKK